MATNFDECPQGKVVNSRLEAISDFIKELSLDIKEVKKEVVDLRVVQERLNTRWAITSGIVSFLMATIVALFTKFWK